MTDAIVEVKGEGGGEHEFARNKCGGGKFKGIDGSNVWGSIAVPEGIGEGPKIQSWKKRARESSAFAFNPFEAASSFFVRTENESGQRYRLSLQHLTPWKLPRQSRWSGGDRWSYGEKRAFPSLFDLDAQFFNHSGFDFLKISELISESEDLDLDLQHWPAFFSKGFKWEGIGVAAVPEADEARRTEEMKESEERIDERRKNSDYLKKFYTWLGQDLILAKEAGDGRKVWEGGRSQEVRE